MSTPATKTILLIESNFFMAQLLGEKIGRQGITTTHARDGQAGLEELKMVTPSAIVLDLPLDGTPDGMAVLHTIHEAYPALPVLILFSTSDEKEISTAQALGMKDFLVKADIDTDTIVAKAVGLVTG